MSHRSRTPDYRWQGLLKIFQNLALMYGQNFKNFPQNVRTGAGIGPKSQNLFGLSSDGQGFQQPHGYTGTGTEGKGQGMDLKTLRKPIPSSRVRGYPWYMPQVFCFV